MKEDTEKQYLAAIVDGDGHIEINKSGKWKYRIRLGVTNTSEALMDYLQATYGGNVHGPHKSKHKNHKDRFIWLCSTKEAIKLIKQIEPYLVIKYEQADLAIEAWGDTFKWDYSRRKRKIPKFALDKREDYYQQMKKLNIVDKQVDNGDDDGDEYKDDNDNIGNEASLYYLAGIIDSEGTIRISKQERYHQIRLFVSNTSEELIDYLQDNYGCRKSGPYKSEIERNRNIFLWQCNGKYAIKLITDMKPYLIIKQKQAELAIVAYENAFKHSYRGGSADNRVPEYTINKREKYYHEMRKLNLVGKQEDENEEVEITLKINKNTLKKWLMESEQL